MNNSNEIKEELYLKEINIEEISVMEEGIQPGGALCGIGCIAAGVWCGFGCPK